MGGLNPYTEILALQWQHERRLVFVVTPTWLGWFCERCCWHVKLGTVPTQGEQTVHAQEQFEAHDCEKYAQLNWKAEGTAES